MANNLMAALRKNERGYLIAKIILITPLGEDEDMNLNDLRAMPMNELVKLYNSMAEKQVKRFESRQKAEERTAQLLRDSGKLEEEAAAAPAAASGKGKKAKPEPTEKAQEAQPAPKPGKEKGKAAGAAPAAAPLAAPKGKKGNGKAAPEATATDAGKRGRGAPTKNPTYTALSEKAKGYNPDGLRINPSSARAKVLDLLRANPDGLTREQVEKKFAGQKDVNVPSALYMLSKYGFAKVTD